ncbi:MAG TPA: 4Fe-4S binding protein [Armatimonadota bacterium]|nr:4Fe-4S binding protein [Armatimonadota bacterium]HOQ28968.1 4Fe-4S binding protein [Armatimonadota bacterium]
MAVRKIVKIDEELCNGCGLCVPSCAEGAIQVIDGKARLVKDEYCDGLGACLGECPQGAIEIIEREAPEFDEAAAMAHVSRMRGPGAGHAAPDHHVNAAHTPAAPAARRAATGSCPGAAMRQFAPRPSAGQPTPGTPSALRQWPVQLHLVWPEAPYFRDADLLLAADCSAFACGDFHARFLDGRALAIACPKLDDPDGYVEKLAAMIAHAGLRSITIVMMEVPCCHGLDRLVQLAMQKANRQVPVRRVIVSIEGEIVYDEGEAVRVETE